MHNQPASYLDVLHVLVEKKAVTDITTMNFHGRDVSDRLFYRYVPLYRSSTGTGAVVVPVLYRYCRSDCTGTRGVAGYIQIFITLSFTYFSILKPILPVSF